jgi:DDE superfamily endonuclease
MPRLSDRKRVLAALEAHLVDRQEVLKSLRVAADVMKLAAQNDNDSDSNDNTDDNDDNDGYDSGLNDVIETTEVIIDALQLTYNEINGKRYLMERKPYRSTGLSYSIFERDLQDDDNKDGSPPWLQEEEFLQKYHMHRASFNQLAEIIKDNPVFHTDVKKEQAPVKHQLLLFLYYLGRSGSSASNSDLRNAFHVGCGTADIFKTRCVKAIGSLRDRVICWPNITERKLIAKRILHNHSWINCIGVVDGTLFPLTYAPQDDDAPDYHGRKFLYSLSTIIVNDDQKRIWYYLAGYPGSSHDNRIFRNTKLFNHPEE